MTELSAAEDAPADAAQPPGDHAVELNVAARPDQLPIVRSVVERCLYLADWPIEDTADVKIATDEACSEMIALAGDGRLHIVVDAAADTAEVTMCSWCPDGLRLQPSGFGWHVITSVTDTARIGYRGKGSGRTVTVLLGKRRSLHAR